ncbi:LppP/LprE family lipoprotein [Myxococcus landrumensis]|uniref:LppP/LprE family lipoprotein n=1 Tax=Myxococcus landrumensis TaxID=2813577 RepID=A0ABX7NGA6_9BACT|nr:LppP/LprE family lipoprotein [Myxococcus landrumus]QSQ16597.1 LppP/LprE family lipoprotein [Myxococcus landrumus]
MSRRRMPTLLCAVLSPLLALGALPPEAPVATGSAWVDTQPIPAWNKPNSPLPKAPKGNGQSLRTGPCARLARKPTTASDRALMKAGWTLLGPLKIFDTTEVITAAAEGDGMCRAMGFQVFVFVDSRFAGTLSPEPMSDRFDGAMGEVHILGAKNLSATVRRYSAEDPLCCPSREANVDYEVQSAPKGPVVTATQATTQPTLQP